MSSTRVLFHLPCVGFVIQLGASHKGQCLYIGRLSKQHFLVQRLRCPQEDPVISIFVRFSLKVERYA